jgi:hypothetical protein
MVDVSTVVQEDHFMSYPLEQLRGKKQDAFIRYLSMNLYEPPKQATWGRYNDRVVNDEWVAQLVNAFIKRLDNCTNEDSLEVAVRRSWIKNAEKILPTVNDKMIQNVPLMEFSAEGRQAIEPDNLVMLGGNHRRLALKEFVDGIKQQLESWKAKRAEKEAQADKASEISGPIVDEVKMIKEKIEWLEKKIASSQHWAVALYDIGRK